MPRFYFHLYDAVDAPDEEGVELPDLGAAREFAERNARFTAAQTNKEAGIFAPDPRIDIDNENGQVLDTVHFGDAVKVEG